MGKLIDLDKVKRERNGEISPETVVLSVVKWLKGEEDRITKIAIVTTHESGEINMAQSTMTYLELVGLHEVAKAMAVEEMDEMDM